MDFKLFPDIEIDNKTTIPTEYDYDFEKGEIVLKAGRTVLVTGLDAIKIWTYKALRTRRYGYMYISNDFGNELDGIIGTPTDSNVEYRVKALVEECLFVNPDITAIDDFSATLDKNRLYVYFKLVTKYGTTIIEEERQW